MNESLVHLHSGLRWILLLALVYAIFNAWTKAKEGKTYGSKDKLLNVAAMALLHTQFLIGLVVYFTSPVIKAGFNNFGAAMKDSTMRFFLMEHLVLMLAAVVLITIGHKKAKMAEDPKKKHRRIFIFYLITLLIILIAIPWPFRFENSGWF
jgi:hypothetical protein